MASAMFRMEAGPVRGSGSARDARRQRDSRARRRGEWRRTGGDAGNIRYSPLDQINATNVKNLKIAWIWRGDNFGSQPEYKNETTPLMVDGVLYFTAGDRRSVVAADPGTGETLWVWRLDEGARTDGVRKNSRGVAYWTDGQQSRIFTVTPGYQLVALDAKNGHPVDAFGKDGIVDLTKEVEKDANFNPASRSPDEHIAAAGFRQHRRHPDVARERPCAEVDEVSQGRHHGV